MDYSNLTYKIIAYKNYQVIIKLPNTIMFFYEVIYITNIFYR